MGTSRPGAEVATRTQDAIQIETMPIPGPLGHGVILTHCQDNTLDVSQNDPPNFQSCLATAPVPPMPNLDLFPVLQILSRSPNLRKCTFAMKPLIERGLEMEQATILNAIPASVETLLLFSIIYEPGKTRVDLSVGIKTSIRFVH